MNPISVSMLVPRVFAIRGSKTASGTDWLFSHLETA